jgi:hypothetical protein
MMPLTAIEIAQAAPRRFAGARSRDPSICRPQAAADRGRLLRATSTRRVPRR